MPRLKDAPARRDITFELEGQTLPAREGESLAASLLAAGEPVFSRSVKYHRPRGPFCMAAACTHCLMRVDGVPNVYTCRTPVRAGMRVERQNAYPSVEHDVFGAIDWLFPRGMDHHEMFAGVPIAQQVMEKVARHLAGLGRLPDAPAPPRMPREKIRTQVLVVGAGPAGLAAARELAHAQVDFLVFDREDIPGGRLSVGALGEKDPPLTAFLSTAITKVIQLRTTAIGLFDDDAGRYVAAVRDTPEGPRLVKAYADRFLVATGGYPAVWPFENNDVPGVFAGRAVSALIRRDGVLPGRNFALVGLGAELYDLAALLEQHGAHIALVVDMGQPPPKDAPENSHYGEPVRVHGRTGVRALTYQAEDGRHRKVACDAVALCLPGSPAYELARQGGAEIVYSEAHRAFVVAADEDGRTRDERLFVAGDVTGGTTITRAAEAGARAARALVQALRGGGAA